MDVPRLLPEGYSREIPLLDARGLLPKRPLPLGQAKCLNDLTAEFAFFTPALLYLYGNFFDGLLIDLMFDLRRDVPLFYHKFDKPLFVGLEAPSNGNSDWNHALWAVYRDDWRALADHLVSITLSFKEEQRVIRYAEQLLTLDDPLFVDRVITATVRPSLSVTAFGINASWFRLAFVGTPPRLQCLAAHADVQAYAAAMYRHSNPLELPREQS